MALLPILTWPDPRLQTPCAPAAPDGLMRQAAADMLDTMYAAPGRGLAGPQVGLMAQIFVMDATWKTGPATPRIFLNPEILWRAPETATGPEGCLSLPGLLADVTRPTSIRLRWLDLDGAAQEDTLTGFEAICAQHEIDHLHGILTLDHLPPDARIRAEEVLS